ncbi:protease SohB [Shewanella yunxiaonensis]|uniref:Protease SohB n=1 Tax=Shewanella yunxiaonensis TaxID=2829809 RepID=A0ABX7YWL1_9GAMM|nr:protease SohB [Shewanella yunxiaonensis]QUN07185.1 protease SohB [Shewanella yunxiaonensis]
MEFLYEYGMFLAKAITIVVAIAAVVIIIVAASMKQKHDRGELKLTHISEELQSLRHHLKEELLDKKAFKAYEKQYKAEQKAKEKQTAETPQQKVFVLEFKGGIEASEVASLREEISAVLAIADKDDQVVINLESGGGMVHGYGLAASQLERLRRAGVPFTVCVDKVAASGGYMMACVANHIVAAPFAIVGSIGVVAQLPNFNRLLRKHDIDYEQHTAGEFKRTLTLFGENTDEGRAKFREELEQTHELFKGFVTNFRPQLDVSKVATGEHWFGQQAVDLGLVDEIGTSDDLLMKLADEKLVIKVRYQIRKKITDKLAHSASLMLSECYDRLLQKNRPM